jgi:hypothetical protein
VFPKEFYVFEHVSRKLSDGAGLQLTCRTVFSARHILVQVEPVRQLKLDVKNQKYFTSGQTLQQQVNENQQRVMSNSSGQSNFKRYGFGALF